MKQRIISGVLGGVLIIGVLALIHTPVFVIFISLLAGISVHEMMQVSKVQNVPIKITSIIFAVLVPPFIAYDISGRTGVSASVFVSIFILALLCFMLMQYEKTRFEHVAISVFGAVMIPYAYSIMIILRDISEREASLQKIHGFYLVLFALLCSWMTDVFAYFVGSKFGKHKLSPKISPKKSVEGAIGGIIGAAVINFIVLFVFDKYFFEAPLMNIWLVIPLSMLLSVISMLGDLSASTLKRNYAVKDFGKIMPGHGGVLDRFDSCLFVLPALYVVISFVIR